MRHLTVRLALALAVLGAADRTKAAPPDQAVHAIVNIDLIPPDQAPGTAVLVGFVGQARRDPALKSMTLIELSRAPNHFILDETFVSEEAYRRFVAQSYVRRFQANLFPHLGSPWDERLGSEVAP